MLTAMLATKSTSASRYVDAMPVKNTFIHFEVNVDGATVLKASSRSLRRWRTDPEEATLPHTLKIDTGVEMAAPSISSDCSSTVEPASDVDPLESSLEVLLSLDFDVLDLGTPEQTPRHPRDLWLSPESWSSTSYTSSHVSTPAPPSPVQVAAPSALTCELTQTSGTLIMEPLISLTTIPDATFVQSVAPQSFGFCFDFTLRLADDIGLGVDLVPSPNGSQALVIQGVLPNGGVAAWNLQCFDGTMKQMKAVWPGDAIIRINGKTGSDAMINECRKNLLLKLTIFRDVHNACTTGVSMVPCWTSKLYMQSFFHGFFHGGGYESERLHSSKKHVII